MACCQERGSVNLSNGMEEHEETRVEVTQLPVILCSRSVACSVAVVISFLPSPVIQYTPLFSLIPT